MLDIKELVNRTGLSIHYIRKCQNRLGDTLNPYIKRGVNNKLLFDNNAVKIFDEIKRLKEDGLSVPEIREQLKATLEQGAISTHTEDQNLSQTPTKTTQTHQSHDLLQEVLKLHRQLHEEKDKRRKEGAEKDKELLKKTELIEQLKGALKLLPEGKDPDQVKREWEQEQKRKITEKEMEKKRVEITTELKNTGAWQFRKRKRLIAKLEELM